MLGILLVLFNPYHPDDHYAHPGLASIDPKESPWHKQLLLWSHKDTGNSVGPRHSQTSYSSGHLLDCSSGFRGLLLDLSGALGSLCLPNIYSLGVMV